MLKLCVVCVLINIRRGLHIRLQQNGTYDGNISETTGHRILKLYVLLLLTTPIVTTKTDFNFFQDFSKYLHIYPPKKIGSMYIH